MANDFVALHLVVRIGPPLHVRLFERPYLACTIFIFWPALHATLAALLSQIVIELRLPGLILGLSNVKNIKNKIKKECQGQTKTQLPYLKTDIEYFSKRCARK